MIKKLNKKILWSKSLELFILLFKMKRFQLFYGEWAIAIM